jgi:hypothetical protein
LFCYFVVLLFCCFVVLLFCFVIYNMNLSGNLGNGKRNIKVNARHYRAVNGIPVKDQAAWMDWHNDPKFMKTGIRNNDKKYHADFDGLPDFIRAFNKHGKSLFKTIKRRADIQNLSRAPLTRHVRKDFLRMHSAPSHLVSAPAHMVSAPSHLVSAPSPRQRRRRKRNRKTKDDRRVRSAPSPRQKMTKETKGKPKTKGKRKGAKETKGKRKTKGKPKGGER